MYTCDSTSIWHHFKHSIAIWHTSLQPVTSQIHIHIFPFFLYFHYSLTVCFSFCLCAHLLRCSRTTKGLYSTPTPTHCCMYVGVCVWDALLICLLYSLFARVFDCHLTHINPKLKLKNLCMDTIKCSNCSCCSRFTLCFCCWWHCLLKFVCIFMSFWLICR